MEYDGDEFRENVLALSSLASEAAGYFNRMVIISMQDNFHARLINNEMSELYDKAEAKLLEALDILHAIKNDS